MYRGNTTLEVLPPIIDMYYKVDPLFFAISQHTQGWYDTLGSSKRMLVTYPGQLGGVATGYCFPGGNISVSGEDFEELEKDILWLKIQRITLGSDMRFYADMGTAALRLNPCYLIECAYPKH